MLAGGRGDMSGRRWAVGFALLALWLQIVVPQGFMVAREGSLPALVICTGHGAVLSRDDLGGYPDTPAKSKSDMVCGFAGHGMAMSPPLAARLASAMAWTHSDAVQPGGDLTRGRSLAAPPPPSQAPPIPVA
jgi:hypothetical protein